MVRKEGGVWDVFQRSAGRKLHAALGEERLAEDSSQNRQPHRPFPRADLGRLEGSRPGKSLPLEALCTLENVKEVSPADGCAKDSGDHPEAAFTVSTGGQWAMGFLQ